MQSHISQIILDEVGKGSLKKVLFTWPLLGKTSLGLTQDYFVTTDNLMLIVTRVSDVTTSIW